MGRRVNFNLGSEKNFEREGVFLDFGITWELVERIPVNYSCAIIEDEDGLVLIIPIKNFRFRFPTLMKDETAPF